MRLCFFLFYFLMTSLTTIAQNKWQSFRSLSGPEKYWIITHPFIANKVRKITIQSLEITKTVLKDSLLDGDPAGGQVDAFRHSFWIASLSQKICWRKALSLGRAHEKGNYRSFKKGMADEESMLPDSVSGQMDLFNNYAGALIGCKNKYLEKDSLKKVILTAVKEREMKIISKNNDGFFLDCSGKILNKDIHFKEWNIPKCLIPSNVERLK